MSVEENKCILPKSRPRRQGFYSKKVRKHRNTLDLDDVFNVLKDYKVDCDGGTNCSVCGKLYKSRVCLIKHIWEHTVYWEMFAGQKNQERVLSIQAALILYGGSHNNMDEISDSVSSLLVTSPNGKDQQSNKTPILKETVGVCAREFLQENANCNITPSTSCSKDITTSQKLLTNGLCDQELKMKSPLKRKSPGKVNEYSVKRKVLACTDNTDLWDTPIIRMTS